MKAFIAKPTNLKYYVTIGYLEQVVYISRYVKFRYKSEYTKRTMANDVF